MKPKRAKSVVFLPDIHFPHQEPAALGAAVKAVESLKPDEVVILGDLLDAHSFSSHQVSSFDEDRARDYRATEVAPARALIKRLLRSTRRVVCLEGNHEKRVERCAVRMGRALQAVYPMISPKSVLSKGWTASQFLWVPHNGFKTSHYKVSRRLCCVHGLSTAKHAAAQHLNKLSGSQASVVFGHTHRSQADTRRDPMTGRVDTAMSPGCLCKLQPLYIHGSPTSWVHGFALAFVGRASHTLYSITVEKGRAVLPDGREVRG